MPQLAENESRSIRLLQSITTPHQFAWAHEEVLREALEWGDYFDSLYDWYSDNILPLSFYSVLLQRPCMFSLFAWNYLGGYFTSFTLRGLDSRGWPMLMLLWKGQRAICPVIILQGRDPESCCKASSSFCYCSAVWIRHCYKGDIWLPIPAWQIQIIQIVSMM